MGYFRGRIEYRIEATSEVGDVQTLVLRRQPRIRVLGPDGRPVPGAVVTGVENESRIDEAGAYWLLAQDASIEAPGFVSIRLKRLGAGIRRAFQGDEEFMDIYLLRAGDVPHARIVVERPGKLADRAIHATLARPGEGESPFASAPRAVATLPPAWRSFYASPAAVGDAVSGVGSQVHLEPVSAGRSGRLTRTSLTGADHLTVYALGEVEVRLFLEDHEPFASTMTISRTDSPVVIWRPTPLRWTRHRVVVRDRFGRSLDGLQGWITRPFYASIALRPGDQEVLLPPSQNTYALAATVPGLGRVTTRFDASALGGETLLSFETFDVVLRFVDKSTGVTLRGFKVDLCGIPGKKRSDGESHLFAGVQPKATSASLRFYDGSAKSHVSVPVDLTDARPGEVRTVEVER